MNLIALIPAYNESARITPVIQVALTHLRRYAVDHWYRFAKQRLHWTMYPRTRRTLERSDAIHHLGTVVGPTHWDR